MSFYERVLPDVDVYCITLEDRVERQHSATLALQNANIKFNFFKCTKHREGGTVGCWLSHRACMAQTIANNKNALIFEDDVCFIEPVQEQLNAVAAFYASRTANDWDIIYLGGLLTNVAQAETAPRIYQCRAFNTHAYLISLPYMKRLLSNAAFSPRTFQFAIDDYFQEADSSHRHFAVMPTICYQKSGFSSDTEWFSLPLLQRIVQHPWLYQPIQTITNRIAWILRCLPFRMQQFLNPYPLFVLCLLKLSRAQANAPNFYVRALAKLQECAGKVTSFLGA